MKTKDVIKTWPMEQKRIVKSGKHKGIVWVTAMSPIYGAMNGYAFLPESHPWRKLADNPIEAYNLPTSVGRGITYAEDGWIGFDTTHFNDIWPDMPDWFSELAISDGIKRWTPEMVVEEVKLLCEEIVEAEKANA